MAQSFGAWLKRQADRGDWIADLSADFTTDLSSHPLLGRPCDWSPRMLRRRMIYIGACTEALEALAAAEAEWRAAW
jgi:hypothetical protein